MKLRSLFRKKTKPVMYEMFGGWGNRIEWFDYKSRKVTGWKQRRPQVGDLIRTPMESGNDGLFKVVSVNYMTDPKDMFFAETEPIGYLSDYRGEYISEEKVEVSFLV